MLLPRIKGNRAAKKRVVRHGGKILSPAAKEEKVVFVKIEEFPISPEEDEKQLADLVSKTEAAIVTPPTSEKVICLETKQVVVEPEVQKVESEKGYYLVIDLEATCFDKWEEKPREELEIIEIGAALVDDKTLEVVSTFDGIIQPKLYPSLSAYCRQLTGITQEMVDNASSFSVVLENFMVWQSMFPGTKKFCSWGEYDKNQLKTDCHRAGVELPDVLTEHFNIKKLYTEKYNNKGLIGLGKAMKKMKLEFVGSPHRGIDDAINIAAVLKKLLTEPS